MTGYSLPLSEIGLRSLSAEEKPFQRFFRAFRIFPAAGSALFSCWGREDMEKLSCFLRLQMPQGKQGMLSLLRQSFPLKC